MGIKPLIIEGQSTAEHWYRLHVTPEGVTVEPAAGPPATSATAGATITKRSAA
jgi:hypothetical protein